MSDGAAHDLVGAYALDALEPEEARRFEGHLALCEACRGELAAHRQALADLGSALAEAPPPGLRQQVLAATVGAGAGEQVPPTPLGRARWVGRPRGAWFVAAAAAVVLVLLVGAALAVTRDRNPAPDEVAEAVLADPAARTAVLAGDGGAAGELTWSERHGQAVVTSAALGALDPGRAYEVWFIHGDGAPRPGPLLTEPVGEGVWAFPLPAEAPDQVALTVEPASGSPAPTGPILLAGALPA